MGPKQISVNQADINCLLSQPSKTSYPVKSHELLDNDRMEYTVYSHKWKLQDDDDDESDDEPQPRGQFVVSNGIARFVYPGDPLYVQDGEEGPNEDGNTDLLDTNNEDGGPNALINLNDDVALISPAPKNKDNLFVATKKDDESEEEFDYEWYVKDGTYSCNKTPRSTKTVNSMDDSSKEDDDSPRMSGKFSRVIKPKPFKDRIVPNPKGTGHLIIKNAPNVHSDDSDGQEDDKNTSTIKNAVREIMKGNSLSGTPGKGLIPDPKPLTLTPSKEEDDIGGTGNLLDPKVVDHDDIHVDIGSNTSGEDKVADIPKSPNPKESIDEDKATDNPMSPTPNESTLASLKEANDGFTEVVSKSTSKKKKRTRRRKKKSQGDSPDKKPAPGGLCGLLSPSSYLPSSSGSDSSWVPGNPRNSTSDNGSDFSRAES